MTGILQISTIGLDAGPFNIFSNVNGFTSAFETGVTRNQLLTGHALSNVPNLTTTIRAVSVGQCTNYIDIQ
jgi:hypothetical protein